MDRTGRNVAPFSSAVSPALAAHRQRHLSFENDVRGFDRVSVVGIATIRAIFPDIRVAKALVMQFLLKFGDVHRRRQAV